MHIFLGVQKEVVCRVILGALDPHTLQFSGTELGSNGSDDRLGQAALQLKHVGSFLIETVAPYAPAGVCLGQLDDETDATIDNPHAAR